MMILEEFEKAVKEAHIIYVYVRLDHNMHKIFRASKAHVLTVILPELKSMNIDEDYLFIDASMDEGSKTLYIG